MLTLLLTIPVWLNFYTAKGEVAIRQDTITAIIAQKSTNCTTKNSADGKSTVTECPMEFFICTSTTCQGITWEKNLDELKKIVIPSSK